MMIVIFSLSHTKKKHNNKLKKNKNEARNNEWSIIFIAIHLFLSDVQIFQWCKYIIKKV